MAPASISIFAHGPWRKFLESGRSFGGLRAAGKQICGTTSLRNYATLGADLLAPPLLLKLRSDMKSAMRVRDTNRLAVLRGVLAEVTNLTKTSNPVKTDIQLLAILRKHAATSRAAAEEFKAENRSDLKDREMAQVAVIEEYASQVETIGEEEIKAAIQQVVDRMRTDRLENIQMSQVLKALLGPKGAFEGKPVDRKEVARLAKLLV